MARGRLGESRLEDVPVIYQQQPKVEGANHFGARLLFTRDGPLFVMQNERFDYPDQVRDLSSRLGKIVRLNPNGSMPRDNPFIGHAGVRPEIMVLRHAFYTLHGR